VTETQKETMTQEAQATSIPAKHSVETIVTPPSSDTLPTVTTSDRKPGHVVADKKPEAGSALAALKKANKVETGNKDTGAAPEVTGGHETAAKRDPDPAKVDRLNRIAARDRERAQEIKQLKEQLSAAGAKQKELDEIVTLSKTDRVALLEKLGLDLDTIGRDVLKQGRKPKPIGEESSTTGDSKKSPEVTKLAEELEQFKREQAQREQLSQARAQVHAFTSGINEVISKDIDSYELTVLRCKDPARNPQLYANAATEDAVELAEAAFKETGKVLPFEIVAKSLEAYYEREAEAEWQRLSASKKLQQKFGLTKREADEAAKEIVVPPATKKAPSQTLGNSRLNGKGQAASNALPAKKPDDMSWLAWTRLQQSKGR